MLIKAAASIIIIASCTAAGFILSRDCARRPAHLRELQGLMHMLENEISYMSNLLEDAFQNISAASSFETSGIFAAAAAHIKEISGLSASAAWEKALDEACPGLALNNEDRRILVSFGKMLGNSDLDGQVKNIRLAVEQLKLQEKKAEESRSKNELMYKRLGLLLGIAIVIVLI